MRWLIVEDALLDRKGHWLEWVSTFYHGFRELNDEVVVLADAKVEPAIRAALNAVPVLPPSIWHRMGDGAGALTRYGRVFSHAWQTRCALERYLSREAGFDCIFVPTVLLHHLLAWAWLIKRTLRNKNVRVLLFFLTGPVQFQPGSGKITSDGSPSAKLLVRLLKWLEPEIKAGKVVLGVETTAMKNAMEELAGVPFVCFPQPVASAANSTDTANDVGRPLHMACYGAARAEKGSDVLQQAIALHRQRYPGSQTRFTVQWIDDFTADGTQVSKLPDLLRDPRVQFVTRYFADGEYAGFLQRTDVMLLPYRLSSYAARGSRVVIEAAVNGIPVVTTQGTTLADVALNCGSGLNCKDGDPKSLANAIREMELCFSELRRTARARQAAATTHFSVATFRNIFPGSKSTPASQTAKQTGAFRNGLSCASQP